MAGNWPVHGGQAEAPFQRGRGCVRAGGRRLTALGNCWSSAVPEPSLLPRLPAAGPTHLVQDRP